MQPLCPPKASRFNSQFPNTGARIVADDLDAANEMLRRIAAANRDPGRIMETACEQNGQETSVLEKAG